MLIKVNKLIFCFNSNFAKSSASLIQRRLNSSLNECIQKEKADFEYSDESCDYPPSNANLRSLRIGIIGLPNAGKSTLINELVGRPICAASVRAQTTREKTNAIFVEGNTQLVFADTPGLVSKREIKKFSLEKSFKVDAIETIKRVDMVGVVHDVSDKFSMEKIDKRVLFMLKELKRGITTILIMNKVDAVKRKRDLLHLVDILTGEQNWPNFSDIFMVSALESDGIDDLRQYLIRSAKPKEKWEFEKDKITDDTKDKVIERSIKSKFLDHLPQEIPYKLKITTEHLETLSDGSINVILSVNSPTDRISRLVMGKNGSNLRNIALSSEEEMSNAFRTTVRIKLIVKFKEDKY